MTMKNAFRIALAALVLLASQAAMALGLGQLRMKSGLGEPLLAEIPIVSSVPGELERLHVGLASPETFARIGLEPPRGVVADLRFALALGDDGRPVIRVTSAQPIDEPMLNFLVEVDWGQGRLVREYSALVDAPRAVAAPLAPPVEAPVAAPSSAIVRTPAADADQVTGRDGLAGDRAAAVEEEDTEAGTVPAAGVPPPVPAATPAPARPEQIRVEAGQTLSGIASGLASEGSLEQAMIALLRANPGAFIGGNIHRVRAGAVLRVPGASDIAAVEAAQALAQVREQTRAWRQATQAVAQPEAAADAAPIAGAEGDTDAEGTGNQGGASSADGARLEIVPPGASDAVAAGSRSGISDGGEGDTMRQELQQANEALAARDAELEEIKSRMAELEKIQADQQQLITMKDNELASVQAELAQARGQPAEPVDAGAAGWWIGGGVLLALVLLGAWWFQRRADQVPRFRAPTTGAPPAAGSMASTFPLAARQAESAARPAVPAPREEPAPAPMPAAEAGSAPVAGPAPAPDPDPAPEPEPEPDLQTAADAGSIADASADPESTTPDRVDATEGIAGHERLELARAFVQLGDVDSARQLLTELVVNGDLAARQEATRLLRELD